MYGDSWTESTRDIYRRVGGWLASLETPILECGRTKEQLETREALVPDLRIVDEAGFSFENVGGTSSNRRPDKEQEERERKIVVEEEEGEAEGERDECGGSRGGGTR